MTEERQVTEFLRKGMIERVGQIEKVIGNYFCNREVTEKYGKKIILPKQ